MSLSVRSQQSPRRTVTQRWAAKVRFPTDPEECWEWIGGTSRGYGRFWSGRSQVPAHRYGYERFIGPIPVGLTLDHLCRNRSCVNPEHLEPVSMRVNLLRGIGPAAKNARQTLCLRGHPLAGTNLYVRPSRHERVCRTCRSARKRAYRAPVRGIVPRESLPEGDA